MKTVVGIRWAATFLVAIAALAFAVHTAAAQTEEETGAAASCPPQAHPSPIATPTAQVELQPESGRGVEMPFYRSREPKVRKAFFGVSEQARGGLPNVKEGFVVRKRPLVRDEFDGVVEPRDYVANLRKTSSGQLTLTICVDPLIADDVDPGTYRGQVVTDDPRIQDVAVPVAVSLQYTRWPWVAVLYGLLVAAAGSFFVWAGTRTRSSEGVGELHDGIGEWVKWLPRNVLGLGIGSVAAASVFSAMYLNDPGWGAVAPTDWFTLLAAMFTAFTTGLTGGRASLELPKKRKQPEKPSDPDQPTEPDEPAPESEPGASREPRRGRTARKP